MLNFLQKILLRVGFSFFWLTNHQFTCIQRNSITAVTTNNDSCYWTMLITWYITQRMMNIDELG